ncbi:MAG: hypothetical protein H2B05_05990 [Nitrosopumilaceae archaeon]|uniref:Uncharacterized protein n=1 Tax=Candidatus Nitrosomaritimum aestuariumsis TaxID=3342354 RepID=A0AC60W4L7_9ARCH|nr:hypothetical protein [Nitrosopumilaceae archaeon]
MNSESSISEYSEKLEKLGKELAKIQYDFKIENKPSEKYWSTRIEEFNQYHTKVNQYFTQAYSLMNLVNEGESGLFLLKISKLKQLGVKLIENMEKIKQNPSIMDLKDKQQSKWSIERKEELIKSNKECLDHEKHMNVFFREFYEKNLKTK